MTEPAPRLNMRPAAESYARMGLCVFPIAPRSKVPLTPRGVHDATTDLHQIGAWWSQWPDANIGIACGERSGLFVVDIDGPEGEASLAALEAERGPLPPAPTVVTGKGRHMYFRHYPGARNSAGRLGERVDTRGDGGYVVAPPSMHESGRRYEWDPGAGPGERRRPEVPEWLCEALAKRAPAQASTWTPSTERDAERSRRYCIGALEMAHRELAQAGEGTRNERLRDAAYALAGYVPTGFLDAHEIESALSDACRANGAWQTEQGKCIDTMRRAIEAGIAMPRDIPAPRSRPFVQAPDDTRTPEEVVPLGEPPGPQRTWKTAREIALGLASAGPPMPTHFETLDEWTRGGLRCGKLVAIGGAPGAGKTALALQLGHVYHDGGCPVAVYAADEARDGLLGRWGQQCGMVREDIEEAAEPTRAVLAQHFERGLVDFIDPDDATLDAVIAWLLRESHDRGMMGVLVVDSIQTCRVDGGDGLEPKQRIDLVVRAIKAAAAAGLLVIATSEVARGFYRSSHDRIDPLAAFKESGAIEYALAVGIVLASVKGEVGQVDAYVPKNRLGRHSTTDIAFRLRLDFDRCTFVEIPLPDDGDGETHEPDHEAVVEGLREKVLHAIITAPHPIGTRPEIYQRVRGRRVHVVAAVSSLIAEGRITGGRGTPYRVSQNRGEE